MSLTEQPMTAADFKRDAAEACRALAIEERHIAREVGRHAEDEPDPRTQVDLYMYMLERDLKADELEQVWVPHYESQAEAAGWAR